jgi:hypothetical protein
VIVDVSISSNVVVSSLSLSNNFFTTGIIKKRKKKREKKINYLIHISTPLYIKGL